jgi:hypothetical protein
MSTPIITYDKRPVIVSPTAPTSLEQLRYLWLDISETTPVLRYYNSTGIWEAINNVDTSSFLTTNGVQTITGAKTFNTGTITVADITVDDVTIEGIDTIKLTDDDTHVPTSKLVEDTLVSAISGLETSIDGELATKANTADVVLKTDISTTIPSAGAVNTKVASEKAVADSLAAKQNTLKYYSEGDNTVTIETAEQPNNNISIKAGITGLEMGRDSSGTSAAVKLGVFREDTVTQGLTVTTGRVDITAPGGFKINNSTPNVTAIVDSINLQSGGENALPTASAVRVAVNQIKTDLGSALTYKGSVDTYDQLPEEAAVGDTWNVAQAYQTYPAGTNYAWTGSAWDALGGSVDLSGYQTKSDDTLATTAKTVVGAINELSADKQNTLKYYSESDSSTEPSSNNAQVSILKSSDYQTTLNLGFETSNGIQTINIGGSSNTRNINIGTKNCGSNNNVTIGNARDGVLLTLNTGRGLAGTGVTKDLSTSATDAQFPTAAAVNNQLILKQNITDNTLETTDKTIVGAINEIENKVLDSHLSKLPYGTLYFDNAKLFGSNFAIPNFPFSICATVRVDSWEGSTQGIQTIFQFGDNGNGALWGSISFNNVINNPNIQLRISKNTDGTISYSEVSYLFDKDTFLGKEHTIIGVCRELESTPVNFDIYVDGTKVATSPYKGLTLDSLSGTVNYAVNTYNQNYSIQPASAHPMMLRNLYVFNFDVSAEGSPYSIADYVAGRLIPPALKPSQVSLALENYTIARNATTKLVKDASGNSNDATVQGSGTVAGDNDQSIKVFVDEIKTQTPLTSLQFNVYGTDKKIIPGQYMRLVFSQDSNGNVTPTYISEEEWNDVYDV